MSTLKVNELRHISNTGTANIVLESNNNTNLQTTSTKGLSVDGTLTVTGVSTFNGNVVVGNASTDTVTLTSTMTGFNNFSGFTGEIRMYAGNAAGNSPPAGWLYCNGDTVSSTSGNGGTHYNADGKGNDYQPLFNLLKASSDWGNSSGASWGTNTVKTPDFRSRSPVGIHTGAATSITAGLTSRTLSDAVGAETHALIIAELATHTHTTTAAVSATGQSISTITANLPNHEHSIAHTHAINPPNTNTEAGAAHTHGIYGPWIADPHYATAVSGDSDTPHAYGLINSSSLASTSDPESAHIHAVDIASFTSEGVSTANTGTTTNPAITVSGGALGGETHGHTMTTANTGSGTAHTILSPIIAVNYIIKV